MFVINLHHCRNTGIVADMLKFLNVRKLAPFSSHGRPRPVAQIQQGPRESHGTSSALKIVHPGGIVECYYMAIPAVNIIKKYPSFVLARPEVFRRPWDSLVRSHEILSPGEKLYAVPRRTIRKLRQRIKKPGGKVSVSQSFIDVSKEVSDSSGVRSSFSSKTKNKNGTKKHVRFAGIDINHKTDLAATKTRKGEGSISIADTSKKESQQGEKRKSRNGVFWQPRLEAISESHGTGD